MNETEITIRGPDEDGVYEADVEGLAADEGDDRPFRASSPAAIRDFVAGKADEHTIKSRGDD